MLAIEDVWSQYRQSLKRFLHAKVSDEAVVDDLLQDILLKTYNNLGSIKENESIKSWLFQIANHTIIDFYRQQSKAKSLSEEALWYNDTEQKSDQDLSRCLQPFINALPEDTAKLLNEIELGNKTQKAYAEELGISYSTLKSRVQKGRTMLRALFEDCCHLSLDRFGNVVDFDEKSNACKKC